MDQFFYLFEKSWKTLFLALVGLTEKGTSVRKKDAKKDRKKSAALLILEPLFDQKSNQKSNQKNIRKTITRKHEN